MEEQYSRRNFLKKCMFVSMGAIAGGGLTLLLREKSFKKHVTHHELFGGDVKMTRTETTQMRFGIDYIQGVELDFEINRRGIYLFEGWVMGHRSPDVLEEKWEYKIDEVPSNKKRLLHSLVYRLEATRNGKNGGIDRDTKEFRHYGN